MPIYLLGEAAMAEPALGRMPGLCDYRNSGTTFLIEHAFDVDVRRWYRKGLIVSGTTFLCHWLISDSKTASLKVKVESDDRVRLIYRVRMPGKRWRQLERPVSMVWDSCRFGGRRPWFICPICGRSMAVLYLGGASPVDFCCRVCARLKYTSQRGGPRLRSTRKLEKIRRQLGGSGSLDEPFPDKPRTMQWKRYLRIWETAVQVEEELLRRSAFLFRWFEREANR
jgi:hypothetical protein